MPRYWTKSLLTALVCLMPAVSGAQGRTAGQIVGTVKDASGAVVPKADLILIDNGDRHDDRDQERRGRGLRVPEPAAGPVPDYGHVSGVQPRHHSGSRGRNRTLGQPRRAVRGRRGDRASASRGTVAGRRDDVDDHRQHREQRADLEAAARRTQHPGLRAARSRRSHERRRRATANTTACRAAPSTSRSTASTTTPRGSAAAARACSCSRRFDWVRSKR